MGIRIARALGATLFAGLLACHAAAAQDASSDEARRSAYRQVAKACDKDSERFCPMIAHADMLPRDQVLCLKTYRVDLTLGCRSALAAVAAATEAEP